MDTLGHIIRVIASMKRLLITVLTAIALYLLGVWAVLSIFSQPVSGYFSRIEFWSGLLFVAIFTILRTKWPKQTSIYTMGFVCITLLAIGVTLIFLAGIKSLWDDPPWEASVFGAGVSIVALSVSLTVAFWPRRFDSDNSSIGESHSQNRYNPQSRPLYGVLRTILKRNLSLFVGSMISIFLLVAFILLQQLFPSSLGLDVRWVVVAAVPLILALITGGYIKGFKGYGLELEFTVQEPITFLDLRAREVLVSSAGIRKQTLEEFTLISRERKRKITRLQFVTRRRNYYDLEVIKQYLRELPNLEYFEVVSPGQKFLCLLPASLFREESLSDLNRFVYALEGSRITSVYANDAITFTIRDEQSIIDVLELLRRHGLEMAVVVDSREVVVGVVKTSDIERRITDEALLAVRRKKRK